MTKGALIASVAAAVLATGAAAEPTVTAAKKCPRGKVAVKIAGKRECRPLASVLPRPKQGDELVPAIQHGLDPTWGETRDGPPTLAQLLGPETKRALDQALTRALGRLGTVGQRSLSSALAGAAAKCKSDQVLPVSSESYQESLGNGAEFGVTVRTGPEGASMTMSATVPKGSGRAVRISVDLGLCSGENLRVDTCPTAQGVVEGSDDIAGTIRTQELEDGEVVSSQTVKIKIQTKLRGRVEDTAKLSELVIDRTESYDVAIEHGRWFGVGQKTTAHRRATIDLPSGSYRSDSSSMELQQSFSGILSFLVNESAARQAALTSLQKASNDAWAAFVKEALDKYRKREADWQKPNTCAQLEFSPRSNTLRVRLGQEGYLTGTVKANRGGTAVGQWKITARQKLGLRQAGNVTVAGARYRYRVDGEGRVSATFRVPSKAGVAEGTWEQGGSGLPRRISGTFSGTSGDDTARISWSGTITFVRDDSFGAPGRAGYAVEQAAYTSTYSINEPHTGCRGNSTGSASLGKQGAGNYLLLDRGHVAGKHRYEMSASLQGGLATISVVCPYGTITQPWPPSALLFTLTQPFSVDSRTWRFGGTLTTPGAAPTTMTWDLRGSQ